MARGPVPYTCPDIDKMISMLEELRASNDSLREWGTDMEDKVDELKSQLEEAENRILELEGELEEARAELRNLESQQ